MENIKIYYSPNIDEEEKKIFKEVFNDDKIVFSEYKTKGISGAAFDVQIIIDFLNNPHLQALLKAGEIIIILGLLAKKVFKRNNKSIMDNNSRPRYTNIVLRMEKKMITISNTNKETKITITKTTANFDEMRKQIEKGVDEYSDKKLEKYIFED